MFKNTKVNNIWQLLKALRSFCNIFQVPIYVGCWKNPHRRFNYCMNDFWPVVINLIISLYNYYNNNNNNENGSPLVRNWRPFPTQMDKKRAPRVPFFPEKKRSKSCLNLAQKEGFSLEFVKASIALWVR